MAQLIEEVSVLAADRRRKEPRSIPRPGKPGSGASARTETGLHATSSGGMQAVGLEGILAMAQMAPGQVTVVDTDAAGGES